MMFFEKLYAAPKKFIDHQGYLHAAALTFYTLLSLVPLIAAAFFSAEAVGLESIMESFILERLKDYEEFAQKLLEFAKSFIFQAKSGATASIWAALFFWIVLTLFASLENAINQIWEVPEGRPIAKRLIHYFLLIFLSPLLAILSSVISIIMTDKIFSLSSDWSPFLQTLWASIPLAASWILFSVLYKYVPNTKTSWKHCIIAGLFAGTLYHFVQWSFVHFQIGAAEYGAVFGSFAAFPLFLVWLQASWVIFLFGAELSCSKN